MAKREFEVIVTRTGSQDEREQAYREAIRFLLFRLPEQNKQFSQVRQTKVKLRRGGEGEHCTDIFASVH